MWDFDGETMFVNCAIAIGAGICLAQACGSGNSESVVAGDANNPHNILPESLKIVLKSAKILPSAGGLIDVTSAKPEFNGASLSLPSRAVANEATISLGVTDLPANARPGQLPVGPVFALIPSG